MRTLPYYTKDDFGRKDGPLTLDLPCLFSTPGDEFALLYAPKDSDGCGCLILTRRRRNRKGDRWERLAEGSFCNYVRIRSRPAPAWAWEFEGFISPEVQVMLKQLDCQALEAEKLARQKAREGPRHGDRKMRTGGA
jgi:hypothetical protein